MKILIISKYFPREGGIERYVNDISESLTKRGHNITIIAAGNKNRKYKIGKTKIITVKESLNISRTPITFGLKKEIMNQYKKYNFDIAHLHEPNPYMNFIAYQTLKKIKKPYIVTYHSDIIRTGLTKIISWLYEKTIQKKILNRSKSILVTSKPYVEYSSVLQKYKKKIRIIPNMVDTKIFTPSSNDSGYVLFVGRLSYYKGLSYLLKSIKLVSKNIPDIKFKLVGSGELKKYMEKGLKELGIEKNVKHLEGVSDKKLLNLYKNCSFLVLPSIYRSEAFGIVQLEAFACGKPVISTKIPGSGVSWVNKHNVTGLVVPPGNSQSLSAAIIKLYHDKQLRKKLGKGALARSKEFSKTAITAKILTIYKNQTFK